MLILIAGYSGSGKDTLATALGIEKIKTCTTRPKREGEDNYIFLSEEEFNLKKENNEFFETTSYTATFGDVQYGTLKKDVETKESKVLVVNPDGLKAFTDTDHLTFFLYVSPRVLKKRLSKRGDDPREIKRRLKSDEAKFDDFIMNTDVLLDGELPTEELVKIVKDKINEQKVTKEVSEVILETLEKPQETKEESMEEAKGKSQEPRVKPKKKKHKKK